VANAHPEALVSAAWLSAHLDDPAVKIVDATYKMPGIAPTAAESYAAGHIPGSVFFDSDAISDKSSSLPHMLPPASQFASQVGALGIGDDHRVIVYDGTGVNGAARAWWMFRVFGHDNVAVLDGGLPAWIAAGQSVDAQISAVTPASFTPRHHPERVRSKEDVRANLGLQAEQLLDARSAARFRGEAVEPWPGRRSGHIPGSFNLDHTLLVDPSSKLWKSADEVASLVAGSGIDPGRAIVTSCGSGITACVLALGLYLIGVEDVAVYDGSWAEWGLPEGPSIATGIRAGST
jgi:thiosulfate/3-mercaptopyruvate sulfurtransferase